MTDTLLRPEGHTADELKTTRRALGGLFFAGYAVAALAADAQPITTDDTGLVIEEVSIPHPQTPLLAYVARPQGEARHGAVIVVSEIFGLHAWIKDVCRRFAKEGYVAVAPAFFHRSFATLGDPATKTEMTEIRRIVNEAGNEQVMSDVGATLAWLRAHPSVRRDDLAITGFCWGGTVVWTAAARFPELAAGAAWYGRVEGPADPAQREPGRKYPIELASELNAPVLGLYGALDRGIPVAGVQKMQEALKAAGKRDSEIVIYPEADHGFLADYRQQYHKPSADDAWAKTLAHFRKHL